MRVAVMGMVCAGVKMGSVKMLVGGMLVSVKMLLVSGMLVSVKMLVSGMLVSVMMVSVNKMVRSAMLVSVGFRGFRASWWECGRRSRRLLAIRVRSDGIDHVVLGENRWRLPALLPNAIELLAPTIAGGQSQMDVGRQRRQTGYWGRG